MEVQDLTIGLELPDNNLTVSFGENPMQLSISMTDKYTIVKRIKWWLFCKVFPCRIVEFRKGDDRDECKR